MRRRDDELRSERESRRERRMKTMNEEEEDREYELNNIRSVMEYQNNILKFGCLILSSVLLIFYLRPFTDRTHKKRSVSETRSLRSLTKKSHRSSDTRSRASMRSNSTYDSLKSLSKVSVKV
jgi:hypothetical protein